MYIINLNVVGNTPFEAKDLKIQSSSTMQHFNIRLDAFCLELILVVIQLVHAVSMLMHLKLVLISLGRLICIP